VLGFELAWFKGLVLKLHGVMRPSELFVGHLLRAPAQHVVERPVRHERIDERAA
jgi:hypothetical protein